jgi:hypothetical protein
MIVANPVGLAITAVIGVLAGLVAAFKSTDKGGTEFAARFEQIKAVLDVVRQRLILMGEAIAHIFKGEWREAGASLKETFSGIKDQLKEATRAAYEYTWAMDALEDSEHNYISTSADNRNKIAQLEFIAQDRKKSLTERRAALKEAIRLGEEETKNQRDFARQRLEEEAKYLASKNGLRTEDVIAFTKMSDTEQANASASLQTLRNNNEKKLIEIENLYAIWMDISTRFYEENKRNISRLSGFELEEIKKRQDALKALKKTYEDVYRAKTFMPSSFAKPVKETKGALVDASKYNKGALDAKRLADELEYQIPVVNDLAYAFENMFMSIDQGLEGMAKTFANTLKQMVAQMAARAALFGIFSLLSGGTGGLAMAAGSMIKGGFAKFMGFADGGIVSGPTLAGIGEYAGAKNNPEVVAPLSDLKGLIGGQTMNVKVTGKLAGKDIYFSTMRYAEVLRKST